jgi:hypothetical protein
MLQQLEDVQESWQEHAAESPEAVGQLQVCVENENMKGKKSRTQPS